MNSASSPTPKVQRIDSQAESRPKASFTPPSEEEPEAEVPRDDNAVPPSEVDAQADSQPNAYLIPPSVAAAMRSIAAQLNLPHARLASIVGDDLPLGFAWLDRRVVALDAQLTAPPPENSEALGMPLGAILGDHVESEASVRVLVGPSGIGKSTSLQMLAADAAAQVTRFESGVVPVLLDATALVAHEIGSDAPDLLTDLVRASPWTRHCADDLVLAYRSQEAPISLAFLIDAVDQLDFESMGNALESLAPLVVNLGAAAPGSTTILSSREDVWFASRCEGIRRMALAFQLQSLSLSDIDTYIRKAGERFGRLDADTCENLHVRIAADPMLGRLLRRPLMLALGVHVASKRGELPDGLGGICAELTDLCLESPASSFEGGRKVLDGFLTHAAWMIESRDSNSMLESLPASEFSDCVRAILPGGDRQAVGRSNRATDALLEMSHSGLGVFGELAPNEYGFTDEAFRMFFLGQFLATRDQTISEAELEVSVFREALVVWAECCAHRSKIDPVALLVEDLMDADSTTQTVAAGEILAAISGTARRDRERWLARWSPRLSKKLDQIRSGTDSLEWRDRAGRALSRLDDPILRHLPFSPPLAEVAGGVYVFGSSESVVGIGDVPKYELIHWSPFYEARLEGFRIGVHPVTNFEYGHFVDAGGYSDMTYWESAEADRWVRQQDDIEEWLEPVIVDSLELHYRKDIEAGFMSVPDFSRMRDRFVRNILFRDRPLYWRDQRFNRPNQPVVGINAWEAQAYCKWLERMMVERGHWSVDELCRLPTEEEWEVAAAHQGAPYPWGSRWDPDLCHMRADPWLSEAVSIGTFSATPTAHGCQDMIGNVFDATCSRADEYLSRPCATVARGMDPIVTRGGSWLATAAGAKSVRFRSWDPPCNAYADQSFRFVVVTRADPNVGQG